MKKIVILIIATFILLNCQKNTFLMKNEFEKTVFYEIFPALIDSIHYDFRLVPPPPPPPSYIDENGKEIKIDSTQSKLLHLKAIENWKKRKEKVLKDTTSTYLTVPDSINYIDKEDFYELISHFKKIKIDSEEINFEIGYRIDINKLTTNQKKLKFKYRSEEPNEKGYWNKGNNNYVLASLSFTKIIFDKTKSFGVFNVSYIRGRLDANGSRIYIKKSKDGKWIIDKVEGTWIS